MISYLLTLIAAIMAATEPADRCLADAKDALPDAKAALNMETPPPNPLDGFEPPKVALPYVIPAVTETEFNY